MASTYLSKTFGSGDQQTWTFSCWFKRAKIGNYDPLFCLSTGSPNLKLLRVQDNDKLLFYNQVSGSVTAQLNPNMVFRDTSAWYHIVMVCDTTNATSADRLRMYVNGERITDFTSETQPSQNANLAWNANVEHRIGKDSSLNLEGSLAHVHFTDGTAYDADDFGQTDSTTGIWKPKLSPSVTYGTNGFFLKFENSSAFGTDSSGNSNTFTVNGTMTQTIDTPSNVFATWNSLIKTGSTFSNGNLSFSSGALGSYQGSMATIIPTKGKWYGEIKVTDAANLQIGFITADTLKDGARSIYSSSSNIYWQDNVTTIKYYLNGSSQGNATVTGGTNSVNTYTTNDIIMLAMDLDNGYGWFGKNGTWENSGDPGAGTNAFNLATDYGDGTTFFAGCVNASVTANFGNGYFGTTAVSSAQNPDDGIGIFEYDVPIGYRALCTKSINAEEYD